MTPTREQLELAAKAAGIELEWVDSDGNYWLGNEVPWNPLTDDGDALRLAVKLKIEIVFTENTVWLGKQHQLGDYIVDLYEPLNNDPYAATRRAIVRAAAELGRGME